MGMGWASTAAPWPGQGRAHGAPPRAPSGRLRRRGAGAGADPRVRGRRGRDGRPPARSELPSPPPASGRSIPLRTLS